MTAAGNMGSGRCNDTTNQPARIGQTRERHSFVFHPRQRRSLQRDERLKLSERSAGAGRMQKFPRREHPTVEKDAPRRRSGA